MPDRTVTKELQQLAVGLTKGLPIYYRLAELFADAANGLMHLHEAGVLHRDLKPGNLICTADAQRLVIMDLGLARMADQSQGLTTTGSTVIGTLRYMAPEQAHRQSRDVDHRADIYSLAAALYEVATGQLVFDGDNEKRLMQQVLTETPRPPRDAAPDIPSDLATVIQVAMAKDPDRRYQSARDLEEDLRAVAEMRPISARPAGLGHRLTLFARALSSGRLVAAAERGLAHRTVRFAWTLLLALLLVPLLSTKSPCSGDDRGNIKVVRGSLAKSNIKATRNFEYMPSDERVEQERREAADKVLPVFDYQADLGQVINERINRVFALPAAGKTADRRKTFSEVLQIDASDEDLEQIQQARDPVEIKVALLQLVSQAMDQLIVIHLGALQPFKDGQVLLRHMISGKLDRQGEKKMDTGGFQDLQTVRDQLAQSVSVYAARLPEKVSNATLRLAQKLIVPNVTYNHTETDRRREDARNMIGLRTVSVIRGQILVREGEPITREHISILGAMESRRAPVSWFIEWIYTGLLALVLLLVVFNFGSKQFERFFNRPRDLLSTGLLLVLLVALCRLMLELGGLSFGQELPAVTYAIPVAAGAMLTRLLVGGEAAAILATLAAFFCGLIADSSIRMMAFFLVTGLVGAARTARARSRHSILLAGLLSGLAGIPVIICSASTSLYALIASISGGLLSAFLTLALQPALEWLFAYPEHRGDTTVKS